MQPFNLSPFRLKYGKTLLQFKATRNQDEEGSSNHPDTSSITNSINKERRSLLLLFTVPLAWGSYEPAVRYVYALDPPVPALLFSFGYFLIASLALLVWSGANTSGLPKNSPVAVSPPQWPIRQGMELGIYLFAGNMMQLVALQTISADRSALLLQIKVLLVPIVEAMLLQTWHVMKNLKTWIACLLALLGVVLIEVPMTATNALVRHGDPFHDLGGLFETGGDVYIFMAALVYTLHVIRLTTHAQDSVPIQLAAVKACTECACALVVISLALLCSTTRMDAPGMEGNDVLGMFQEQGRILQDYFHQIHDQVWNEDMGPNPNNQQQPQVWRAVGAMMWTGLVTIAYTIQAQTVGQQTVRPVTANLIYSLQPLGTAAIAWLLLDPDTEPPLGPQGMVGAVLLSLAVLLVVAPLPSWRPQSRLKD